MVGVLGLRVLSSSGKLIHVGRSAVELDEPLVTDSGVVAGIDGSGRVVGYRAVEIMACAGNGCVGVMYHKLLAECVDEVLDASRDGYFERLDHSLRSPCRRLHNAAIRCTM